MKRTRWTLPVLAVALVLAVGCSKSREGDEPQTPAAAGAQSEEHAAGKAERVKPVTRAQAGQPYLAVYDPASNALALYDLPGIHNLAADGSLIAYLDKDNKLCVFNLETGENRVVYDPPQGRGSSPALSVSGEYVAMNDWGRKRVGDYRVLSVLGGFDRCFNVGDTPRTGSWFDGLSRCTITDKWLAAPDKGRKAVVVWNIDSGQKRHVALTYDKEARYYIPGAGKGRIVFIDRNTLRIYNPRPDTLVEHPIEGQLSDVGVDDGKFTARLLKDDKTLLAVVDLGQPEEVLLIESGLDARAISDLAASGDTVAAVDRGGRMLYLWKIADGSRRDVSIDTLLADVKVADQKGKVIGPGGENAPKLKIVAANLGRTLVGGRGFLAWCVQWDVYLTVPVRN